ncbi:hypothetical protein [Vibrio europaeus]|uniref:hypothetical protein n=1 Tax=Vibrio europaeus TaxID=300876 RepID=UPI0039E1E176
MDFKFYLLGVICAYVLTGCNDDSSSFVEPEEVTPQPTPTDTSSLQRVYPTLEGLYEITVLQTLNVAIAQSKMPVIVTGTFADGSTRDITKDVRLVIGDVTLATVTDDNQIYGVEKGITWINAESSGITSKRTPLTVIEGVCGGKVNDDHPISAMGKCIKVLSGKGRNKNVLHTFTPSIHFMNALGFTEDNSADNDGLTYARTYRIQRDELNGLPNFSPDVPFALFRQDGVSVQDNPQKAQYGGGGQLARYCALLAQVEFVGRRDWKVPSIEELQDMATDFPMAELYYDYGVPVSWAYWSASQYEPNPERLLLQTYVVDRPPFNRGLSTSASGGCVSIEL